MSAAVPRQEEHNDQNLVGHQSENGGKTHDGTQQQCQGKTRLEEHNDQNLMGQQSENRGNTHDGTRHELPTSIPPPVCKLSAASHAESLPGPVCSQVKVWPLPHRTPAAPPRSAGAGRASAQPLTLRPEVLPPQQQPVCHKSQLHTQI